MPKRIKVGVITHDGGAHLSAYFAALAASDEVESVALADPSSLSTEAAKKALGDRLRGVHADVDKMLQQEKPVLALVSMEAALAPPMIERALDAGCHVFAEKPACVRIEDFDKLARKADSKHLHLMLALANRLNPPVREARRLIRSGAIGKLYGLEMHIIADQTRLASPTYAKNWFAQRARAGGGHLIWLGIHWLDLAMHITGAKIQEVAGFKGVVGGQPLDVEDSAAVAFRFDNGTFGTLTSGYYLDRGYHSHIKVWGSRGWLQLEPHGNHDIPLEWSSTDGAKAATVQRYDGPKEPSGYTPFVQAAVRAAAGLQEPPITAADGLHVLKTIFAFYKAAETGQTQRIAVS